MMRWVLGSIAVMLALFGWFFWWYFGNYPPENRAACFAAGGDRFIEQRSAPTCWREDGTRVWF